MKMMVLKAIRKLQNVIVCGGDAPNTRIAISKGIKALQKQIRKKVLFEDVGYNIHHSLNVYACICPSCGLHIITFDDDDVINSEHDEPEAMFHDCLVQHNYEGRNEFCNRCGQKLYWGKRR